MKGSKPFSLGEAEAINIFKVFAWTVGSALVVLLIDLLGVVEVPAQYAFIVPMVNTALYALKEWVADNRFN